ncbi:hypothetical protein B0H13DRAFT_1619027 [Mycena leptocephala]|nr:hypothetical protein B0H13DRAFT_1619027 [Mycena leptocephala]
MPLPQGVPTLRAKRTGNLTRPDNVFCSDDFLPFFIACDAYPARTPGTTDHFPIISEIDLVPPGKVKEERWNWRAADWEELVKKLEKELALEEEHEAYADLGEVLGDLEKLDEAVWRCVEEFVPKIKVCTRSKRWWTPELSSFRKEKERLARKSYRQRDIPDSPAHEEYRTARNTFSDRVRMARRRHWVEWLTRLTGRTYGRQGSS